MPFDSPLPRPRGVRLRHQANIDLIDLLRPGAEHCSGCSIEMAFQTLRMLLVSGIGYRTKHRWHTTSITSLLGGYSVDHGYPVPVQSIADLFKRFHMAVLAREDTPEIAAWRRDTGINAYASLKLAFPHYRPSAPVPHLGFGSEAAVVEAIKKLLEQSAGQKTAISLNSVHYDATVIHRIDVTISPSGFSFDLRYGCRTPEDMREHGDSEWGYCLARTIEGEPFLDTLRRAIDHFEFVTAPENSHLTTSWKDEGFFPKDVRASSTVNTSAE